jgi:hypothetical protein
MNASVNPHYSAVTVTGTVVVTTFAPEVPITRIA